MSNTLIIIVAGKNIPVFERLVTHEVFLSLNVLSYKYRGYHVPLIDMKNCGPVSVAYFCKLQGRENKFHIQAIHRKNLEMRSSISQIKSSIRFIFCRLHDRYDENINCYNYDNDYYFHLVFLVQLPQIIFKGIEIIFFSYWF